MNRRKKEADQHKGWNYIYFRCVYCNGNGNRPDFGSGCNALFLFRFTGMQWSKVQ